MADPTVSGLIDHQASLQRQLDQLSQEVLCVAVAGIALSLAVILIAVKLAKSELGE